MKQQFTAQSNILDWYKIAFPTDDWAIRNMSNATFENLLDVLEKHEDVYKCIFNSRNADSIVRERVFEKLAEIINVDYGYIYCKWLEL